MNSLLTELNRKQVAQDQDGRCKETFHFNFRVPKTTKGMLMLCQDKTVGEPLPIRFCILKETEPVGGSSLIFFPALTISCHEIEFTRGTYEVRLQVLEPNPAKLAGGVPIVVVAYTEYGVRQIKQVDEGPHGTYPSITLLSFSLSLSLSRSLSLVFYGYIHV